MHFLTQEISSEVCFHTISEGEYKYVVPHSLYHKLQLYLLKYDLISNWYKNLDDKERKIVQIISGRS
jgi:hypothetical protein